MKSGALKSRMALLVAVLAVAGCGWLPSTSGTPVASIPGYHLVRDIPLPGNTERWDYQAFDSSSHRLYITHLGGGEVVVFDVAQQKAVGIVKDISSPHGAVVAAEAGGSS